MYVCKNKRPGLCLVPGTFDQNRLLELLPRVPPEILGPIYTPTIVYSCCCFWTVFVVVVLIVAGVALVVVVVVVVVFIAVAVLAVICVGVVDVVVGVFGCSERL